MQLNGESADHESFKASTGWLDKFKNRHGIRNLSIQGEKLSAAEETVEPFLQKLNKVIEERGLIPEQIYNADETGLLWKCLPQRTLINIHIFDYPDSRLSGLFTLVPPSPDNRGSTVPTSSNTIKY